MVDTAKPPEFFTQEARYGEHVRASLHPTDSAFPRHVID